MSFAILYRLATDQTARMGEATYLWFVQQWKFAGKLAFVRSCNIVYSWGSA